PGYGGVADRDHCPERFAVRPVPADGCGLARGWRVRSLGRLDQLDGREPPARRGDPAVAARSGGDGSDLVGGQRVERVRVMAHGQAILNDVGVTGSGCWRTIGVPANWARIP